MTSSPNPRDEPDIDVLVRTFNSARFLDEALVAARRNLPVRRIIVVDRNSTDRTVAVARAHGAEVFSEEVGLGYATTLAIEQSTARWVVFLDSDVIIRNPDFWRDALDKLAQPGVGAVVGCSVGHRFLYGLPLSLTMFRRAWIRRIGIPPTAQGRETYYIQRALAAEHLKVDYVLDAMVHRSVYRGPGWPEWQGAQTRLAAGWSPGQLAYSAAVVLLIHMNSHSPRNVLYTPVFLLHFLRGYLAPERFRSRDRRQLVPT